jgi:hypothetical protein
MITNIIDRRNHPYRFLRVNAIVEATWHDHSVDDSDAVKDVGGVDYQELEHSSLKGAIAWAQGLDGDVTLYIYDHDGGMYAQSGEGE